MTFDQFTHLLAVLAWPTVALIAGVAAVHCCRLLTEVLADESERWRKSSFELALLVEERRTRTVGECLDRLVGHIALLGEKLSHDASFNTTRWLERLSHLESFVPAMLRALAIEAKGQTVGRTAEAALLTLLNTNGGLPGSPNDDTVRQIVREVRKLYEEVDKPTQETQVAKEALRAPMADQDDLTLDELFGAGVQDEEDEL